MSFDPTKPVQTRDGRKARILATDLIVTSYTLVGAIICSDGEERIYTFLPNGRTNNVDESRTDLINIPEKTVRFVNTYPDQGYESLEVAKANSTPERRATVELTYADGKLIDVIVHS